MIKCEYIFHEVCLGTKQKFDRVEKNKKNYLVVKNFKKFVWRIQMVSL